MACLKQVARKSLLIIPVFVRIWHRRAAFRGRLERWFETERQAIFTWFRPAPLA
jgi:hypothetical protein